MPLAPASWMMGLLGTAAFAADDDDVSVTALGVEGVYDGGLGAGDVDPLLSERLRWTLAKGDRTAVLLADARFALDPNAEDFWEENRVRTLGVELGSPTWTVELGRSAVSHGGPRLVDGIQVLHRVADGRLTVGGWAGLAPDLFTTRPMLRGGGGPIVAWAVPELQASVVGEVLFATGGLDRLGLLTQARWAPSAIGEVSGRLDGQLAAGKVALADGAVSGRWRPVSSVRLDALYDAYSSLRYLQTGGLDPDLQRFVARSQALGLGGLAADLPDPSVYQLFGLGGAWQGSSLLAPRVALTGRYRYHPRPEDRYAWLDPQVGVSGLAQGRVDATVDVAWTWRGGSGSREDVGLDLIVDPSGDGRVTVDGSIRGIADPAFGGKPGWYADLFVDLLALPDGAVSPGIGRLVDGTVLVAGLSATREPSEIAGVGVAGLVWLQHRQWLRPSAHPPASPAGVDEPALCAAARRTQSRDAWASAFWADPDRGCRDEALDQLRRAPPAEAAPEPSTIMSGEGSIPAAVERLETSTTRWRVRIDSGVEGYGAALEPLRAAVERCVPEALVGRARLLGAIGPTGAVRVGAIDGDPAIARCVTLDGVTLPPGAQPRPFDVTIVVDR